MVNGSTGGQGLNVRPRIQRVRIGVDGEEGAGRSGGTAEIRRGREELRRDCRRAQQREAQQLEAKDRRIKQMSEILAGIKILKLNAWEKAFVKSIEAVRSEELAAESRH